MVCGPGLQAAPAAFTPLSQPVPLPGIRRRNHSCLHPAVCLSPGTCDHTAGLGHVLGHEALSSDFWISTFFFFIIIWEGKGEVLKAHAETDL